jgi:hypothetical protein
MPKQRTRVSLVCEQCGTSFTRTPSEIARGVSKFCSNRCSGLNHTAPVEDRFWTKVSKDGPIPDQHPEFGSCWDWTGALLETGYGSFQIWQERRSRGAHRVAWRLAGKEPIPPGIRVLHTCDRRSCVRNDEVGVYEVDGILLPRRGHLFLGTHRINMVDMASKGRQWLQNPDRVKRGTDFVKPEGWVKRGERSATAILTADIVRDMRRLRAEGHTLKHIAELYGVHYGTVWKIANHKTWTHVV